MKFSYVENTQVNTNKMINPEERNKINTQVNTNKND